MSVSVMEDYKLRDLRASHTLGSVQTNVFFFEFVSDERVGTRDERAGVGSVRVAKRLEREREAASSVRLGTVTVRYVTVDAWGVRATYTMRSA
jgi:hypothetical protein